MQETWVPASVYRPQTTAIDGSKLHRASRLLEAQADRLVTHLREIANNAPYQRHKGIFKARRREIASMREMLDLIEEEIGRGLPE